MDAPATEDVDASIIPVAAVPLRTVLPVIPVVRPAVLTIPAEMDLARCAA